MEWKSLLFDPSLFCYLTIVRRQKQLRGSFNLGAVWGGARMYLREKNLNHLIQVPK